MTTSLQPNGLSPMALVILSILLLLAPKAVEAKPTPKSGCATIMGRAPSNADVNTIPHVTLPDIIVTAPAPEVRHAPHKAARTKDCTRRGRS